MKIRHIAFIILLLSAVSAFADKKVTIRNAETGESFELSVPNGLEIYEYDSTRLDSVPYLVERARYGEPWAYKALGDCYRYGKGGVERSVFKSLAYYTLSGMDVDDMTEELVKEKPLDHLSLIYKLIWKMEHEDKDGALCVLDTLTTEGYHDAEVIKDFIGDTDTVSLARIVKGNIMSPHVGTDKMLFTLIGCSVRNWFPESFENKADILKSATVKFPYLYNEIAVRFFRDGSRDMDPMKFVEKKVKAISFLEKADAEACLSRKGASILYNHYKSELEAGRMVLDVEDMERLATLAKLPESKRIIFSDSNH